MAMIEATRLMLSHQRKGPAAIMRIRPSALVSKKMVRNALMEDVKQCLHFLLSSHKTQ
jgi:hypothetical protein